MFRIDHYSASVYSVKNVKKKYGMIKIPEFGGKTQKCTKFSNFFGTLKNVISEKSDGEDIKYVVLTWNFGGKIWM